LLEYLVFGGVYGAVHIFDVEELYFELMKIGRGRRGFSAE
jgi:hypothetical protein